MENLAFNYISAIYLQQQQQQRAVAQMALLNRQKAEAHSPLGNISNDENKNKKLSFGMDTILGTSDVTHRSGELYHPVCHTSPTKPMMPFMGFSHQKSIYDGHLAPHHHRAQSMTFTPQGMGRITTVPLPKSKRNRTVFTNDQLERLEIVFERSKYLVGNERSALASELGLNETQVKVWFQNRRIKFRKQSKSGDQKSDSCHDSSNASSESESESSSIEIIPNP